MSAPSGLDTTATPTPVADPPVTPRERGIVAVLVATQFINILEFMMVMPLGPELAADLGFGPSRVGVLGAAYTVAAGVAGVLGSRGLDRLDRRLALAALLAVLGVATAIAGLATSLPTLLLARILAGLAGGPASSLALAIVADVVPVSRRGRAMGALFGAFSVASVVGVPLALELAESMGWRTMFFALGAAATLLSLGAYRLLPPLRAHLDGPRPDAGALFAIGPPLRWAWLGTFVSTVGMFALVPNLSTWVQGNLGYPRDKLGVLYFFGGIASLLANVVGGRAVDRIGGARVGTFGSLGQGFFVAIAFLPAAPLLGPLPFFVTLMVVNTLRVVALQTLASRVAPPALRASFSSSQSAVQHFGAGIGAGFAAQVLTDGPNGSLLGLERVAWLTIAAAIVLPIVLHRLERELPRRS